MMNNRNFSNFEIANKGNTGYQVGSVYKTDDYSIFKLSKFNRTVLLHKAMIEQASQGLVAPIIVNEDFVVIDGQHRLAASKEANVPVEYIIKRGLGKNDIVRMNTIQRRWSLKDYVEAYANQGTLAYQKLAKLINEKMADTTSTIEIAINSLSPNTARKAIENGDFEFWNYERAVEFLNFYKDFCDKTRTPKRSKVTIALYILFRLKKFDAGRMITKVVQTGLNEEIKVKTFDITEALKDLLDAYNSKLSASGPRFINYHIASNGSVIIDEEMETWAED